MPNDGRAKGRTRNRNHPPSAKLVRQRKRGRTHARPAPLKRIDPCTQLQTGSPSPAVLTSGLAVFTAMAQVWPDNWLWVTVADQ